MQTIVGRREGGRGGPSRPLRLPARIHLPPQHCHSDRRRQKKLKKRKKISEFLRTSVDTGLPSPPRCQQVKQDEPRKSFHKSLQHRLSSPLAESACTATTIRLTRTKAAHITDIMVDITTGSSHRPPLTAPWSPRGPCAAPSELWALLAAATTGSCRVDRDGTRRQGRPTDPGWHLGTNLGLGTTRRRSSVSWAEEGMCVYKGFTHSNLETYSIYPWVKNPSQCTTMDRENILELGRHKCKTIRASLWLRVT